VAAAGEVERPCWAGRVVLGLGSGRSGTKSLAGLLAAQPGCHATHEMVVGGARLEWEARRLPGGAARDAEAAAAWRLGRIRTQYTSFAGWGAPVCCAAVGSSALPYVHEYLAADPGVRVVVLERPRGEVVASFMAKTGRRNHWQRPPPSPAPWPWSPDKTWDIAFPKLPPLADGELVSPEEGKAAAIGAYWDLYHQVAAGLCEQYPGRVRVFSLAAVFGEDGVAQRALLAWCGFEGSEAVVDTSLCLNKRKWAV
jgi:hypothetical protein